MDTYMATKCSMNLLINHYTPRNSQDEIYLKLNKGYTSTESLKRGDVGDTNELQKVCFVQEMIRCFHRHECDIHLHTQILNDVYDTNQKIMSQIWHTTAYYIKEKWQQLKDLLFN
uniref:Plasmodium RESA N-terminal domain-containing protein n=1 Tax=Panagrolaimus davidi TaxID=227884 RepID=A0A914QX36_9BILA